MAAFRQAAVKLESNHFGNQHRKRLAEHGGFRFNAADAPAKNAEAIHHGGVRIGADERIGEGLQRYCHSAWKDHASEIFDIYLVADAGVRRNDFEIAENLLSPAQESVALDVALQFEIGIETECVRQLPNLSTWTEWSITSSAGNSGLICLGSPPSSLDRFAHGGEVDDSRNAGEILQAARARA